MFLKRRKIYLMWVKISIYVLKLFSIKILILLFKNYCFKVTNIYISVDSYG